MFEVYFDGECPLCVREIQLLRRLDRHDRILFTDIAAPGFDPRSTGHSMDELMRTIRGRMADGTPVEGVEVFRQLYGAVGFAPLVAITRLPGLRQALDLAYDGFARNRLRLTGRCQDGACALPAAA
jgi:predicted DCC family thiol-disulfide oxidoreductase YuxK